MKILVVEDSQNLGRSLIRGLRNSGFRTSLAADGNEAFHLYQNETFDLIVLDLMLPGLDGKSILKRIRSSDPHTRILVLTALDSLEDRVDGLSSGADDYLTKPFAFDELLARIHALGRRGTERTSSVLAYGDLSIDLVRRRATFHGKRIHLTKREFDLLQLLAERPGRILSHAQVEVHLFGGNNLRSNTIDVLIYRLRRKLEIKTGNCFIKNIRGEGFYLEENSE